MYDYVLVCITTYDYVWERARAILKTIEIFQTIQTFFMIQMKKKQGWILKGKEKFALWRCLYFYSKMNWDPDMEKGADARTLSVEIFRLWRII